MSSTRPRQVRGYFTGGEDEIQAFLGMLRDQALEVGWVLTYQTDPVPFGDHGPLHRMTFGFTEAL